MTIRFDDCDSDNIRKDILDVVKKYITHDDELGKAVINHKTSPEFIVEFTVVAGRVTNYSEGLIPPPVIKMFGENPLI